MESSIDRGGLGGSSGALRSEAVANERDLAVLDSQRDVEASIFFSCKDLSSSSDNFDSLEEGTHVIT